LARAGGGLRPARGGELDSEQQLLGRGRWWIGAGELDSGLWRASGLAPKPRRRPLDRGRWWTGADVGHRSQAVMDWGRMLRGHCRGCHVGEASTKWVAACVLHF
jgi:hypothetical protein